MLKEISLDKMTSAYSKAVNSVGPNNPKNDKLLTYAKKIHNKIKDKHGRKAAYNALEKATDDHYKMHSEGSMMDHSFHVTHRHIEHGETKSTYVQAKDKMDAYAQVEDDYAHQKDQWKRIKAVKVNDVV